MAAIEIEEGSPDADAEMHRPLQVSIEAHAAMFEIDLQNLIRSANFSLRVCVNPASRLPVNPGTEIRT